MNSYLQYVDLAMQDTPFFRCNSASASFLRASLSEDQDVKRRFLEHSLEQLDNARERIALELTQLK